MGAIKIINMADLEKQIEENMRERNIVCDELLNKIKANREKLDSIHRSLSAIEPELVYRFYHQSFKVFWFRRSIEAAVELFSELAPDGKVLNSWFREIVERGLKAEFNDETTNKNWLAETRPILEAQWHCKFFVEQMISSADTLDKAPMTLPYDWAAVLYLYDLR